MIKIFSNACLPLRVGRYSFSQLTSYARRGKHRPALTYAVGDKLSAFQLVGKDYYRDFDMTHLNF